MLSDKPFAAPYPLELSKNPGKIMQVSKWATLHGLEYGVESGCVSRFKFVCFPKNFYLEVSDRSTHTHVMLCWQRYSKLKQGPCIIADKQCLVC